MQTLHGVLTESRSDLHDSRHADVGGLQDMEGADFRCDDTAVNGDGLRMSSERFSVYVKKLCCMDNGRMNERGVHSQLTNSVMLKPSPRCPSSHLQ